MKQAFHRGRDLWKITQAMQKKYSIVVTTVDPRFMTLVHWIERVYNRFMEKTVGCTQAIREAWTIESILEKMGKVKLQQLQAVGEQSCSYLMHYSKIAQLLLPYVQNTKADRDIAHILDADLKSLSQLRDQLKKAIRLRNEEHIASLEKAVNDAEAWYRLFEPLHVPDWQIKKWIIAGHKSQDDLKAKYDVVMAKKIEIKLKFQEGDTRVLNKIHKWNQIALDCRALVNPQTKITFTAARLHELDELINWIKRLVLVPEIKKVQDEFVKIKRWDAQIMAYKQMFPVDLKLMRAEINKAKKEIPKNYHVTFDYYLEQIETCEQWGKET